ncbi:hypothetical protein HK105_208605 [Polyrhizophydium stewartii]|uniref:EGF-like domain-containing protein n=1 Tax=Polyrhizophydium stewartii TaxID=2732419 RepID=A0ABR4MX86_9FUNG
MATTTAKTAVVVALLVLLLYATKPDEASFHAALEDAARAEGGPLWSLVSRGTAFVMSIAGMLQYVDYGLFAVVRVDSGHGMPPLRLLGVLGNWYDASRSPWLDHVPTSAEIGQWAAEAESWAADMHAACPDCVHGVCVPTTLLPPSAQCLCMPSWTGRTCEQPLSGRVTLWDGWLGPAVRWLSRRLPPAASDALAWWSTQRTFFGLPVKALPRAAAQWLDEHHLIDTARSMSILDLFVASNVALYAAYQAARALAASGWSAGIWLEQALADNFTASWDNSVARLGGQHTLVTAQMMHVTIVHLAVNMYGLLRFGPLAYQVLGDREFAALVAAALAFSAAGSLLYAWLRHSRSLAQGVRGSAHVWRQVVFGGAGGWVAALRMFVLVVAGSAAAAQRSGMSLAAVRAQRDAWRRLGRGVLGRHRIEPWHVWAMLGPQVVSDLVFVGNVGGALGGMLGALLFVYSHN